MWLTIITITVMFTTNYKFSSFKNSNLWFKLQLGIGMIFFLGMCAAVSGLAERNTHIFKRESGPSSEGFIVPLCGGTSALFCRAHFRRSSEQAGGLITHLNGSLE